MKYVILRSIRFYQRYLSLDTGWLRYVLPTPRLRSESAFCRFTPRCSEYMYQAIEGYGIIHGLWLGVKRIVRCHPWSAGGSDPVPKIKTVNCKL